VASFCCLPALHCALAKRPRAPCSTTRLDYSAVWAVSLTLEAVVGRLLPAQTGAISGLALRIPIPRRMLRAAARRGSTTRSVYTGAIIPLMVWPAWAPSPQITPGAVIEQEAVGLAAPEQLPLRPAATDLAAVPRRVRIRLIPAQRSQAQL